MSRKTDAWAGNSTGYHSPGADIPAIDPDVALDGGAGHEINRPVDALQQRRLPGIGRADDAEDLVLHDVERDIAQRDLRSVARGDMLEGNVGRQGCYHFFRERR